VLPLANLKVIAVEQYGAGPFGTTYLADMGADVIKVENPTEGGELGRRVGPFFPGPNDSHFFQSMNRNKRSLVLDLKREEGQAILKRLVSSSDAVLNNLRGDQPVKLGLTYDQLSLENPALVCVHLSAYGREGSRASWPGFDYLMQAETGHMALTGDPEGPPEKYGLSVVDYMTGLTAGFALLAGVCEARATGIGRDFDVSLFDVALYNLAYQAAWYLNDEYVQPRVERSAHASIVPCQLYRTADSWIFVMCNKEKFWPILCGELGHAEWEKDPRFATAAERLKHRAVLTDLLDGAFGTNTTADWLARLSGRVPVSPVNDLATALDSEFVAERKGVVTVAHPGRGEFRMLRNPIRPSGDEQPLDAGPEYGADTDSVLAEAGFGLAEISQFKEDGVVG